MPLWSCRQKAMRLLSMQTGKRFRSDWNHSVSVALLTSTIACFVNGPVLSYSRSTFATHGAGLLYGGLIHTFSRIQRCARPFSSLVR